MDMRVILTICILIIPSLLFAQSQNTTNNHHFKKFRTSFTLGQTYIPQATSNNVKFVVIPTLGLDFQYWITPKWGVGLKNDIEIANYVVQDHDGGPSIVRHNPLIIAVPALFSPWENHFTFIMGPGIELEEHQNFFVFRAGVGSEFEVGNHWDFAPEIIYDLKNGNINALTIAIAVGKRF
jgi:hypothetical protein